MKTTVVIALCAVCISCARHPESVVLDNGYSFVREELSPITVRWTLRRDTPEKSGVVAQALVSEGTVISLLPTPVHYISCVPVAHLESDFFFVPHIGEASARFRLLRSGAILINKRSIDQSKFKHMVSRFATYSTDLSVILEVQTPCRFADFTNVVTECVSIAGGGFAATYGDSYSHLELEEFQEPVVRDEEPDIPISINMKTAEQDVPEATSNPAAFQAPGSEASER